MNKHRWEQASWTSELETRLIEMYRTQHTMEEIARELSLPLDEIETHIQQLALEEDPTRGDY